MYFIYFIVVVVTKENKITDIQKKEIIMQIYLKKSEGDMPWTSYA